MATMIKGSSSPFSPTLGTTVTMAQCYARYDSLTRLEEDLSAKAEKLDDFDFQELLALTNLVMRDRTTILSGKERISVHARRYYYVQCEDCGVSHLKDTLQNYSAINTLTKMMEAFETTNWYRGRIIQHMTVDYVDMLSTLKSVHQCTIHILQVMGQCAITFPIATTFQQYTSQQKLNDDCNEQIFLLIRHHDQLLHSPQHFVDTAASLEDKVIQRFRTLEATFVDYLSLVKEEVAKIFHEVTRKLPPATSDSFTVTIHTRNLERQYHEKRGLKMLNGGIHMSYALSLMVNLVQQMESYWKMKFKVLSRKSTWLNQCLVNTQNERDLLERSLSRISHLHAVCIQNILLNRKIAKYSKRERDLANASV